MIVEGVTIAAWGAIALVHLPPAAVLFVPALSERMYGVPAIGAAGPLLVHRGGLFLAVVAVAGLAAWMPSARPAACLVAGLSMTSFLIVYARAGMPPALRRIALADLVSLPALVWVSVEALGLLAAR